MPDPTIPAKPTADQLDATTGGDLTVTTAAPAAPARAERYALDVEIARGGMGVVYQATDTVFDREVAIQVLQDRFSTAPAAARRFATEARIAGQLQHPGIPPVHDLGTLPDGRTFLAMKLIKGDTLDELLKQRRDPVDDRGRFVAVFEQVCQAVAYAHSDGVIHRDLKPANVMVGKFGEVQVMDWGVAKVLSARTSGEGEDPNATTGGTITRHFHARDVQLCRGLLRTPEIVAATADLSYAHYRSGTLALRRGDPAAAQFYYRRCVLLREEMAAAQPNNSESRLALARALARSGDHLGAVAAFEPVRRRFPGTLHAASRQAVVYGLCADALRAGRPVAALPWPDRAAYDQYLDEALAGLDRAVSDWDWLDIVGLKTDPDFDPLRADPRFADVVRKVEARIAGRKF